MALNRRLLVNKLIEHAKEMGALDLQEVAMLNDLRYQRVSLTAVKKWPPELRGEAVRDVKYHVRRTIADLAQVRAGSMRTRARVRRLAKLLLK